MSVEERSTVPGHQSPPALFTPSWPGPGPVAPVAVLGAVAAAGVVAAASVPLDRTGVGWALTGLTMLLGLRWVAASRPAGPGARASRTAWALAALALLAVGAVRDAGWLFVLCLLASVVAGALAVVGPRTVPGMVGSLLVQPAAVLRALPWAVQGLTALRSRRAGPARLGAALGVSLALLVVFGSLFAAADAAFAELTDVLIPAASTLLRWAFLFLAVGAVTLGAAYLLLAPPDLDTAEGERRRVHRLEWAVPIVLLDLLFAAFVTVQLTALFGGSRYVLRTTGLTFAEYARRGFWQLLIVTVLTLAVLAAAGRWAPRTTVTDRVWVRVLLGTLATLTLVILASAVYRMVVYMQAYGFTQMRVFVIAVELALGVVFVLVLAAGVRLRGGWLPQAVVATGVAMLLGLAVLNPDRFVADRNIDRFERGERLDVLYLRELSADAVPALYRLPEQVRNCVLHGAQARLAEPEGWQAWNLGRAQARQAVSAQPPVGQCQGNG
ncbi:MAG TPA: DUF4173 domain-containing protein [Micromonosporaceae bacterium]|nr:DUF4173 domain-containing protein [Micromonosporaceae bacterium]